MKKLPNKFRKNGFNYEILKRVGDIAILRKTGDFIEGRVIGYEVVKVCSMKKGMTPTGYSVEAKEKLPKTSQFGDCGWDYEYYENAIKKFNHLVGGED